MQRRAASTPLLRDAAWSEYSPSAPWRTGRNVIRRHSTKQKVTPRCIWPDPGLQIINCLCGWNICSFLIPATAENFCAAHIIPLI
jgi:hypothetical protein